MKKLLLSWATVFMVAIVSVGIVSCSKDDDDNGGGNGSMTATLDGSNVSFYKNAYWYIERKTMYIEFYSFDIMGVLNGNASLPSSMNFLTISYDVDNSQTGIESVTLPSGKYDIYLAKGFSANSEGWQGETWYNATNNSDLIIERNGNNITLKIEKAYVGDDDSDKTFSFSYSGPISLLPEEYRD